MKSGATRGSWRCVHRGQSGARVHWGLAALPAGRQCCWGISASTRISLWMFSMSTAPARVGSPAPPSSLPGKEPSELWRQEKAPRKRSTGVDRLSTRWSRQGAAGREAWGLPRRHLVLTLFSRMFKDFLEGGVMASESLLRMLLYCGRCIFDTATKHVLQNLPASTLLLLLLRTHRRQRLGSWCGSAGLTWFPDVTRASPTWAKAGSHPGASALRLPLHRLPRSSTP